MLQMHLGFVIALLTERFNHYASHLEAVACHVVFFFFHIHTVKFDRDSCVGLVLLILTYFTLRLTFPFQLWPHPASETYVWSSCP